MPDGGKLTIETANCHLDDDYAARHAECPPGNIVMIAVTDTGTGMPPDVAAKAFDPFFTTKAVGKGTGLGLSQVFGFVKQSGGHVKIYSEVGRARPSGSICRAISAESAAAPAARRTTNAQAAAKNPPYPPWSRTMPDVRAFCDRTAQRSRLPRHRGPRTARRRKPHPRQRKQPIDLLFTDVVMPEMSGRELAKVLQQSRPEMKILFTTGYTRNAIVHNGVLDPGTHLLSKPFNIEDLAAKVRSLLDGL